MYNGKNNWNLIIFGADLFAIFKVLTQSCFIFLLFSISGLNQVTLLYLIDFIYF